jgi:hypothetical protein
VRIVAAEATAHPDDWGAAVVPVLLTALAVSFGILGVVVHASAGKGERPPFIQVMALLFLPLLWLQVKISVVAYGPVLAGLWGWHELFAAAEPFEAWLRTAWYRLEPLIEAATLILTVYATPFAVSQRASGRRGAPIRDGLRLLTGRAEGGMRLLAFLLPAIALGTAAHILRGPERTDPVPGIPEGLALLVISYLTLAAVFGAARLLARRAAAAAAAARGVDPGGFGTPVSGPRA